MGAFFVTLNITLATVFLVPDTVVLSLIDSHINLLKMNMRTETINFAVIKLFLCDSLYLE